MAGYLSLCKSPDFGERNSMKLQQLVCKFSNTDRVSGRPCGKTSDKRGLGAAYKVEKGASLIGEWKFK